VHTVLVSTNREPFAGCNLGVSLPMITILNHMKKPMRGGEGKILTHSDVSACAWLRCIKVGGKGCITWWFWVGRVARFT
jgi:hypothetical protein